MDQDEAPMLEALAEHKRLGSYGFTPPGRGVDGRTRKAVNSDVFGSDVLASAGVDDRPSSHGYLTRAEELMADAVRAENEFFRRAVVRCRSRRRC